MGLDIAMHDALAVAEVECLEELEDVISYVVVDESRVKSSEVCVVDILEDQTRSLALTVSHNVE
jgi:hypothetical protein